MAFDPAALREALMARGQALAPPEPGPEELGEVAPEMGMPAEIAPEMMSPEMLVEMEKMKIREAIKRVRGQELDAEVNELVKHRQMAIDDEANQLFSPKAKPKY